MAKKRANGEGNIRKRKDGRWEGRYTVGYDEKTGKRITKSVLGKTQAEVKEKLAKAVAEAESIDVRRADEYTLGTWLQTWYELYAKPRGVLPMFYLELISGLRKGELVALQWADLDIENKTISVSKQAGCNNAGEPDITRPKTENSIRKISIPQEAVELLVAEHQKHPSNPWMFPSPKTGGMYHPDSVVNIHKKILKDAGLEHLRFHDLRHPYVKPTTKIFSLRLMDFQAQAYPDAPRKTRGACQLHQREQSRSSARPPCNRKQFPCLSPQSKISRILYAISMRLSGYTSTRSISSSASSVVSVSASKIALDASLRLSSRVCSSCFCFACANTAA